MGATASRPLTAQDYRDMAHEEARKRGEYFQASTRAFHEGRRAEAKLLSDQGKACTQLMTEYNTLASSTALKTLNPPISQSFVASLLFAPAMSLEQIDLHQLFVNEALAAAKLHLGRCREKGIKKTRFITGRGANSVGGVARIKPRILEWLDGEKGVVVVRQRNEGVVEVEIIANEGGCVLM